TPLGLITSLTSGFPDRFPAVLQWTSVNTAETAAAYRQGTCFVGAEEPFVADDCIDKANSDEPLIFLWGDSHAAHLYPGLRSLQKRHQFRIAQFTVSACAP